MQNSITIYSNGIAAFIQNYLVSANKSLDISIPFNTAHISDVLGSLNILGGVRVAKSPTYTPNNANISRIVLKDDDSTINLLRQLGGAQIEITLKNAQQVTGRIVGLDEWEENCGGTLIQARGIGIYSTKYEMINFNAINSITFPQDEVKNEISKALSGAFQSIKKNSSYINLTLANDSSEQREATLQFVLPTAAWSMSYRVIQNNGKFRIEGHANIHNNTDQDWKETKITVVTGDPYTFVTDIADQKIPQRSYQNFVKGNALGGLEANVGMVAYASPEAISDAGGTIKCSAMGAYGTTAKTQDIKTADVGDFTMFTTSEPVTLEANRSTVVKILDVKLPKVKTVLHYSNGNRPSRAILLNNDTKFGLSRGPCDIYNDDWYEGRCILSGCRPNESRLLLYAQENGVFVNTTKKTYDDETRKISIKNGIATVGISHNAQTIYTLQNSKDEAFEVYIDHLFVIPQSKVKCSAKIIEELAGGTRFSVSLAPKETLKMVVDETKISKSNLTFNGNSLGTVIENVREISPEIKNCLSLRDELAKIDGEIAECTNRIASLESDQCRLRENLKASSQDQWLKKMHETENEITASKEQQKESAKQKAKVQNNLNEALKKLVWEN